MASIVPTVLRFNRVTIKNLSDQINQNGLRSGKQLKMVRQNRNSKFSEISAVLQHKSRRLLYVPSAFSWQRQYFNTIIEQKKPDDTNVSSMQKSKEIKNRIPIHQ
ncbi:uncharacterized protein LOC105432916 [Pogonomyrmex barbatus]|uniref:Uncharacterized protein LOC105432916 n=1 Tax=Pogonomyrmex barbatus TaxID=144034 RepID=A0A6I9WSL7_9HYME|nr:uncharacterized protein LOC105432916 [Pogonomyrmex barbatus]